MATIAVTTIFTASYLFVYALFSIAPQENAKRVEQTVQAVCDYAQSVTTKDALQSCYAAENASNTEYICSYTNCHVEEK